MTRLNCIFTWGCIFGLIVEVRVGKANFIIDMAHSKISSVSRPINILDIIKKNSEEKKREKIQKIYTLLGCGSGLVLIIGIFIYF